VCGCNFYPGICEPAAPNSTTPCACDPDCQTASPCTADGHCDTWCPSGTDPDCACTCNYNEYCEAAANYNTTPLPASGFEDTCACDPDCEVNEFACMDDGHCDTWCQAAHDPDCGGVSPCRDRFMLVGERYGDELMLSGSYEDPDLDYGYGWVYLSPDLSSGSAEIFTEFAAEHVDCVDSLVVEAYGVDDSYFGDGAEMYLFNWDTFQFDLLSDSTVNAPEGYFDNFVFDVLPYLACGTGPDAKCYVNAKINASAWDATHLLWVGIWVHTSP
jgi:hypothetical protein